MNSLIKTILFVLVFIVGLAMGLIINNIPFFSIDGKVGIADLANIILAVVVAFLIPISLSPIITNKRTIKDILINETRECINFLISITTLIEDNSLKNESSIDAKRRINYMIGTSLGSKISSLTEQLEISFNKQSVDIIKDIDKKYKEYWQENTEGELMSDDFKFNIKFCISHEKSCRKLESCLKKSIHLINSYK